MRIMYSTILILSILVATFSLKSTDAGRNDWHFQNIGEITDLYFTKNKLFFLSDLNIFGHLNKDDSSIVSRFYLSENERVIQKNNKELTIVSDHNQIIQYRIQSLERIVDNRFMSDKSLKKIKSYVKVPETDQQKRQIYVNDQKLIKYIILSGSKSQLQNRIIYTAQQNQVLYKVFIFEDKVYALSVLDGIKLKVHSIQKTEVSIKGFVELQLEDQQFFSIETVGSKIVLVLKQNQRNAEFGSSSSNYDYRTIIMNENLIIQKILSEKPRQIVKNEIILNDEAINSETMVQTNKKLIFENQNLFRLSYVQLAQQIQIFKNQNIFATLKKFNDVTVFRSWINSKTDFQFQLIVQFSDMKLSFYRLQLNNINQIWKRQQSLAYINRVLFMKYPFSDHLDNDYHRNIYSQNYQSLNIVEKILKIPANMVLRIKEELKDIQYFIFEGIQKIFNFGQISNLNLRELTKFTMSEEQELKLGLKKYVVIVTKKGSIYSIDTKTKQFLWKINIKPNEKLVSLIKLKKDYELEVCIMINFNKEQGKIYVQQILEDGKIETLKQYSSIEQPSIHKLNQQTILIKIKDKILRFDIGQSHGHQKHYYFYTQEEHKITGWKQEGENVFQIWNFYLQDNQNILATASSFRGDQHSRIPLFDNDKVIFKNIDFTNLAILTNKNATCLNLYILNGKTGQVQFSQYKTGLNLNHPVNLVYDQNNVLATYYNNKNKLYQIWTVEQYQQRIQTSAVQMITDYLEGIQYRPETNRQNIIFLSQVYGFSQTIKRMFISESKMSLIRRNMMVVTRDNKLYTINRQLISSRRPKQTALFQNEKYPPYMYLLPYESFNYFSYDTHLIGIQNLRFSSSDMESTIFIFAYGIDNFLIRISPDRTFDMITQDFNYLILIAIMAVVTIGVLYLRHISKKARMIKPHRD